MIMLFEVTKLVDDDVVDEELGRLDEFEIEGDDAGLGATAPAFLHGADTQVGRIGNTDDGHPLKAGGQLLGKDGCGLCPIPGI